MKLIYVQVLGFSFTVCISVQINVVMRNSSGKQYFMIYSGWLKHIRKFLSLFFSPSFLPPSLPALLSSSPLCPSGSVLGTWTGDAASSVLGLRWRMIKNSRRASTGNNQEAPSGVATELPYPPCPKKCVKKTNKKRINPIFSMLRMNTHTSSSLETFPSTTAWREASSLGVGEVTEGTKRLLLHLELSLK